MKDKTANSLIGAAIIALVVIALLMLFNTAPTKSWNPLFPHYAQTEVRQSLINKADPFSDRKWRIVTEARIYNGRVWEEIWANNTFNKEERWKGYVYKHEIAAEKKRQRIIAEAAAKEAHEALLLWHNNK